MMAGHRVYDAHVHIGTALHSGRRYSADDLLRDMDRNGVERALAIPFPVVESYPEAHDEIGAAQRAHPDRLSGAACFPAYLPASVLRGELRRCVEEFGFRALKLQPQYSPLNPIAPRSDYFWEAALEFRLVVVCHTGSGAPFALPSLFLSPARRFPDLQIVLAHSGGPAYYLEAIVAAEVCGNIFLELSSLMPHHVQEVLRHISANRLMIGSDLPESQATELGKFGDLGLAESDVSNILWETAHRLLDV
jgi:uncharacterized protein